LSYPCYSGPHRTGSAFVFCPGYPRIPATRNKLIPVRDAKLEQRIAELRGELHTGLAAVQGEIAQSRASLLRWNFVFWAAAIGAIVGLR